MCQQKKSKNILNNARRCRAGAGPSTQQALLGLALLPCNLQRASHCWALLVSLRLQRAGCGEEEEDDTTRTAGPCLSLCVLQGAVRRRRRRERGTDCWDLLCSLCLRMSRTKNSRVRRGRGSRERKRERENARRESRDEQVTRQHTSMSSASTSSSFSCELECLRNAETRCVQGQQHVCVHVQPTIPHTKREKERERKGSEGSGEGETERDRDGETKRRHRCPLKERL